jgi:hypothetical protein
MFQIRFSGKRQVSPDLPAHAYQPGAAPGEDRPSLVLDVDPLKALRHPDHGRKEEHGSSHVSAQEYSRLEAESRSRTRSRCRVGAGFSTRMTVC